jgi:hypothetical protein
MVTRSYLLEKPTAPSAAMRSFHWTAVPALINGLGALEGQLECIALAVRQSPARTLGAALALGMVLARVPGARRWDNPKASSANKCVGTPAKMPLQTEA